MGRACPASRGRAVIDHKNLKTMLEFWELKPRLQLILTDAGVWCAERNQTLTITSLIRSDEEQGYLYEKGFTTDQLSVHQKKAGGGLGRGADTKALVAPYNQQLLDYINGKYVYDPRRPNMKTVSAHGGTAWHNHFKVMP